MESARIIVRDQRLMGFLAGACLSVAPRLGQEGRIRFDSQGFGSGALWPKAKSRTTQASGKHPPQAKHFGKSRFEDFKGKGMPSPQLARTNNLNPWCGPGGFAVKRWRLCLVIETRKPGLILIKVFDPCSQRAI